MLVAIYFVMLPIDIANSALTLVGSESVLVTLDDTNKAARLCRQNYDFSRRAVLEKHPWLFAVSRVLLDLDANVPAFGFSAQHQIPDDLLRCLSVNDRTTDWIREGKYILSNEQAQIQVRYIYDVSDIELFPQLFVDAVAADLAVRICFSLTQSTERVADIKQTYQNTIMKARFANSLDQSMRVVAADTYTDARFTLNTIGHRSPPGG